jgi:hypothetical protein
MIPFLLYQLSVTMSARQGAKLQLLVFQLLAFQLLAFQHVIRDQEEGKRIVNGAIAFSLCLYDRINKKSGNRTVGRHIQ